MIVDNISNAKFYTKLSATFKKAFEYAQNMDVNTPCGRIDICDGLYVNIAEYSGKEHSEPVGETHNKFIDIQFILKGSEKIGYAKKCDLVEDTPYNEESDIQMWRGNFDFVTLKQSDFLVAYPQDGHAPGFKAYDDVTKKAVFKLRVDKA